MHQKNSLLFVQFQAARGFCQWVLNSRICRHCDVKTSTATPTYFFIIFLTCYKGVLSFIHNPCQVLLLRNHLLVNRPLLILQCQLMSNHPPVVVDFLRTFTRACMRSTIECLLAIILVDESQVAYLWEQNFCPLMQTFTRVSKHSMMESISHHLTQVSIYTWIFENRVSKNINSFYYLTI